MTRIFISYSRTNYAFASSLANQLAAFGHDIFIDVEDIDAGLDWSDTIQQGLDTCDIMLLVVTPAAMKSEQVGREWKYFLGRRKPILPLQLETANLDYQLDSLQRINFETQSFDAALPQLIAQLGRMGAGAQPQAFSPAPAPSSFPAHPSVTPPARAATSGTTPHRHTLPYGLLAVGLVFLLVLVGAGVILSGVLDGGDNDGEAVDASAVPTVPAIDNPLRYPAYAGIPLDAASELATGRTVIRAADVAPGVVRATTTEGVPTIGDPVAPIILAEYADFSCPHCSDYAAEVERILTELVRTGLARFSFNIVTFVGRDYSEQAGEAALCAAEQGAFWEYHSELFDILDVEGREGFVEQPLVTRATELGLGPALMQECLDSDRQLAVLDRIESQRSDLGVNAAPTLVYSTDNGATWQFFTDADGSQTTRGSFEEVKALVESVQP